MKSLILFTKCGLANRLRALASANILAEYTGRKLFVNWFPSKGCNAEWQDLFLNKLESSPLPISSFKFGTNLYDDSITQKSWNEDIPRLLVRNGSHLLALHTYRNFQPEGMTNEAYESAKSSFYRNLLPLDEIQETINRMQRQHFDGCDVTGVHIRRNDHLAFMKKDHRLVCPTGMFVKAMENVLHTNPGTKFFLATDDKKEETLIMRLFPGAVIVYEKEKPSRDTAKGMRDALVDWILLSKTSRIIAPYASSFSEEASAVNRIKTEVVVREDELSKTHFKILFLAPLRTHYKILREDGLKQYFLYAFNYRKRRITNWIKKTFYF